MALAAPRPMSCLEKIMRDTVYFTLPIDAEPLLKMQTCYNLQMAKNDSKFMEKLSKIRKIAAIL